MNLPKFTAVIHITSDEQAVAQSQLALKAGAGGVFLIDHSSRPYQRLIKSYDLVRAALPQAWIGINFLQLSPRDAIAAVPATVQGLWIDDGGIDESAKDQAKARDLHAAIREQKPSVLLFGGVAFKYQAEVRDPARAARLAAPYMDVVTTSGSGTGSAPDPDKIQVMKSAIGGGKLAIASGMSPENAHLFRDHADCFMVASAISRTFDTLDEARVRAMAQALA